MTSLLDMRLAIFKRMCLVMQMVMHLVMCLRLHCAESNTVVHSAVQCFVHKAKALRQHQGAQQRQPQPAAGHSQFSAAQRFQLFDTHRISHAVIQTIGIVAEHCEFAFHHHGI